MSICIGVDAGGTKTAVLIAKGTQVIAQATGAPGAVRPGRALQAASRITAAVRRALTDAGLLHGDVMVVGAAGVGRDPERTELRESLRGERLAERTIVTGDLDIALEAAFGAEPGVVLVSGTGSVAVGRVPGGVIHRRGGYGWQMGDEGSGYALGRAALLAVGQAHDSRGHTTLLTELLLTRGPVKEFDELVRWSTTAEPSEVAALALLVFDAAERKDAVAGKIVTEAAKSLADLAGSLVGFYGKSGAIAVALAGGNLATGRALRAPVLESLKKVSRFVLRDAPLDPAEGALALARRAI
ncbi:MAG TPA: BadF/BadG/BcrA/BcrD ATPase family protein [Gemmatimonadales bacterium]|nr:BadF/BadG/BcrA/BcrD ATPase family protein [Gemmatimonadales bacterium]